MIIRKSAKDIEHMRRSGAVLAEVHDLLAPLVKAGVTTLELDDAAETFIRERGGVPSFKGYNGFAGSVCSSPNDMIVHGIPGGYTLADGDLLCLDCGVTLNGWVSDAARSYIVGDELIAGVDGGIKPDPAQAGTPRHLIEVAWASLDAALEQCVPGNYMGDVSHAVQNVVDAAGYGVVQTLVGHGIGRHMHEEPAVPNYGVAGTPPRLEEGYVLAIEPMITLGAPDVREGNDGWAIYTKDGSWAAHVEHTVAITADGPQVLTRRDASF